MADDAAWPLLSAVTMKASTQRRGLALAGLLAALRVGVVAASDDPPMLRLPSDVTYSSTVDSPGPVTFSHTTHVALSDNRCLACHPQTFSILQPTRKITHEEMNTGRQCGTCHDGTKASGVQDACDHCHRMAGGS